MNDGAKITSGRTWRQWQAHFDVQVRQGHRAQDLIAGMTSAGYSQAEAEAMAAGAVRVVRSTLARVLGCSGFLMLGGILVTCATYSTARASGVETPYFVWFGAVLCGLIGIIYSVSRLLRLR